MSIVITKFYIILKKLKKKINNYLFDYNSILLDCLSQFDINSYTHLIRVLSQYINSNFKVYIIGNGGSAAIASHVSVDLTKTCKISATNFNEADLITCFSNDYGYEKWVEMAIKNYVSKRDLVILISSSGESKNLINAARYCKKNKIKLITLTGFKIKNSLSKLGNINLYVNSKSYNIVELTHLTWLLQAIDYLKKN